MNTLLGGDVSKYTNCKFVTMSQNFSVVNILNLVTSSRGVTIRKLQVRMPFCCKMPLTNLFNTTDLPDMAVC